MQNVKKIGIVVADYDEYAPLVAALEGINVNEYKY